MGRYINQSRNIRTLITIACFCIAALALSQPCSISETIILQAQDSTVITIDVDGLIDDDLSSNQLCGVRLFFSHDQIGNIRMILTSPAGQQVTLIGPGTVSSGLTPAIDWNILINPCGSPAAPDAGFSDVWDNDQSWASLNTYDGIYYPNNGCLDDFNMGSANGIWTLTIENLGAITGEIEFFELIFCNPQGSNCTPCYLFAGELTTDFYTTCQQDIQLRDLDDLLDPNFIINPLTQSYTYVLSDLDDIISYSSSMSQSDTLPPGIYTVCGLAYLEEDLDLFETETSLANLIELIENGDICADLTDRCLTLNISQVDNIIDIDTTLCMGDTLSFLGIQVFDNLDTNILRTNQVTCDSLITIKASVVIPIASISAPQTEVTCGSSVFLDGTQSMTNGSDIEYNWSTDAGSYVNDIGPIAEINDGGNYSLEIISDGCRDTADIVITSVDTFEVNYEFTGGVCVGDTFAINISSLLSIDDYTIEGPDIIPISTDRFTTINPGEYFINISSGTCTRRDSFVLENEATIFDIQVSSTIIDCDSTISRTVVTTDATNPTFTYNGPSTINDNSNMVAIMTPGIYMVTVTDDNGCTASQAFIVEGSADLPQIMTSNVMTTCVSPEAILPLTIDSPFDSIRWEGPMGFMSTLQNPSTAIPGDYTFVVYGPNGCNATSTISLTTSNVSPAFSIIGDTISCIQAVANLCIAESNLMVQWTFDNQLISEEQCVDVTESGQYIVNVLDMNGCTGSGTYDLIDITAIPDVSISADSLMLTCKEIMVELQSMSGSGSSNMIYSWITHGIEVSSDSSFATVDTGTYILTATDTLSGCMISDTVTVTSPFSELLENNISIFADSLSCDQDSTEIIISGIDLEALDIYINQELISNNDSIILAEGQYDILFIDSLMCERSFQLDVAKARDWIIDAGPDITTTSGSLVELMTLSTLPASMIGSIMWSDPSNLSCSDCLNPTLTVGLDQLLIIEVMDIDGCTKSDSLRIIVNNNTNIYFPNVFAPDLEGDNSVWQVYLPDGNVRDFELRIFDRWGNLVTFQTETMDNRTISWDGTYNGILAEAGLYVFTATYFDNTNREFLIHGQISLLR